MHGALRSEVKRRMFVLSIPPNRSPTTGNGEDDDDQQKDATPHLFDERAHDVRDRDRINERHQRPTKASALSQEPPHRDVKWRGRPVDVRLAHLRRARRHRRRIAKSVNTSRRKEWSITSRPSTGTVRVRHHSPHDTTVKMTMCFMKQMVAGCTCFNIICQSLDCCMSSTA